MNKVTGPYIIKILIIVYKSIGVESLIKQLIKNGGGMRFYKNNQKGLSLIELILSLIISIPLIILIQRQVMQIFDSFVENNILVSFKDTTEYVGNMYQINSLDEACNNYKHYRKFQDFNRFNSLYTVAFYYFDFYVKEDCDGYYFLGVLSLPKTISISKKVALDILGGGGGYLSGGHIISLNHSFKKISIEDLNLKSDSVFTYLYFRKKEEKKENEFSFIPQSIYFNGVDYGTNNETIYNICPESDVSSSNDFIILTWRSNGYYNLHVSIIINDDAHDSTVIKLPTPLFNEIYYIPMDKIMSLLEKGERFRFEISNSDLTDQNTGMFPQKFCLCCTKYGI